VRGQSSWSYLLSLPVTEGIHGGGPGGRAAAQLERGDGGASLPQVSQELLVTLHRALLRLREREMEKERVREKERVVK
jgi:hypothetical protein